MGEGAAEVLDGGERVLGCDLTLPLSPLLLTSHTANQSQCSRDQ